MRSVRNRFVPFAIVTSLALAGLAPMIGCSDISRFNTATGQSYCGTITAASFVRAGMSATTRMRLTLDTDHLQDTPGAIWTDPLANGDTISALALQGIPQLASDPLSTFSFGEGHVKDAIVVADLPDIELFVVLSLLQSGDVEVRLLHGTASIASAVDAGATEVGTVDGGVNPSFQVFGVFHLQKQSGDCGLPSTP